MVERLRAEERIAVVAHNVLVVGAAGFDQVVGSSSVEKSLTVEAQSALDL